MNGFTASVDGFWAWVVANGVGVSALTAVLTGVIACLALWSGMRDSQDRSRPMIVAEFRKVDDARGCVELVVRNVGPTLARAVKIDFEPALIVSKDADGPLTKMLTKRYENPIATLTPGQTLRNIWFAAHSGPDGRFVNAEPTPDRVTVKASYQGRGRGRYHDRFDLDVETITLETFAVGSDSLFGRVETMASSLKTLSKAVQEIAHAREEQRD